MAKLRQNSFAVLQRVALMALFALSAVMGRAEWPVTATVDGGAPLQGERISFRGGTVVLARTWYERGFNRGLPRTGLPAAGTVISDLSISNLVFALAPDYSTNNAVLIDWMDRRAMLTPATPDSFEELWFLSSSGGNGAVKIAYTVHYADGATQGGAFVSENWFEGANPAFMPGGAWDVISRYFEYFEPTDPRSLFSQGIILTNRSSSVRSIGLEYAAGDGHASILALSGARGGVFLPIRFSGYTHDMIVEANYEPYRAPVTATMEPGALVDGANHLGTFYEKGWAGSVTGFPAPGTLVTNRLRGNEVFVFPPDYTQPNAVLLANSTPMAVIELETPTPFKNIAFLCGSGWNWEDRMNFSVEHASGARSSGEIVSPHWFQEPFAFSAGGYVSIQHRYPIENGVAGLHSVVITLAETNSPVTRIVLGRNLDDALSRIAIFALSGRGNGETTFRPLGFSGFNEDLIVEKEYEYPVNLAVTSFDVIQTPGATGDIFTVTIDVFNDSGIPSGPAKVHFYMATNSPWSSTSALVGEVSMPGLEPGAFTNLHFSFAVGGTRLGTYRMGCWIDREDRVPESQEIDNFVSREILIGPDLVAYQTDFQPPLSPKTNVLSLSFSALNQGTVSAAGSTLKAIVRAENDTNRVFARVEIPVPPLAPGETIRLATNLTVLTNLTPGSFVVDILIDPEGKIEEASEANNNGSGWLSVAGPDLSGYMLSVPSGFAPGDELVLKFLISKTSPVSNIQGESFPTMGTKVSFSFSSIDSSIDTAPIIAEGEVPAFDERNADTLLDIPVRLPLSLTNGVYLFRSSIDPENRVAEMYESNNQGWYYVTVDNRPDWLLSFLAVNPIPKIGGDSFKMNIVLVNTGFSNAPTTSASIYLKSSEVTNKLGELPVPALARGAVASNLVFTTRLPAGLAPGVYTIEARVDDENVVSEASEFNNIAQSPPMRINIPDLVGVGPILNRSAFAPEDEVRVQLGVLNTGTAASAATRAYFYFGPSPNYVTNGSKIAEITIPELVPQTTNLLSLTFTLPKGTANGAYSIGYVIDGPSLVTEADEYNNLGEAILFIDSQPDLQSQYGALEPYNVANRLAKGSVFLRNGGGVTAPPSKVFFYLGSPGDPYDPAYKIGEEVVPSVRPGEEIRVGFLFNLPSNIRGYGDIYYWVDASEAVTESNEYNNRGSAGFFVPELLPDLVRETDSVDLVPQPGERVTLKISVANRGEGPSGATKAYVYFPPREVNYWETPRIGEIDIPPLQPGQIAPNLGFSFTVPSSTPPGMYKVTYWIDGPQLVAERNEGDNAWDVGFYQLSDLTSRRFEASSRLPRSAAPGDTISLEVNVRNIHTNALPATKVGFFLRSNPEDFSLSTKIGEMAVPALAPGQQSPPLSFEYRIPDNQALGWYALSYWLDPDHVASPEDPANLRKTRYSFRIAVDRADLFGAIGEPNPRYGVPGTMMALQGWFSNLGIRSAPASKAYIYFSPTRGDFSESARVLELNVPELAPDSYSIPLPFQFRVPSNTPPGLYYFGVRVDALNEIAESEETNNITQTYFSTRISPVGGLPDLTASDQISRISGVPGDRVKLTINVKNIGDAPSAQTKGSVYFRPDPNDFSPGRKVAEFDIYSVDVGSTSPIIPFTFNVPTNAPFGTYAISYWIDSPGLVAERNENNNRRTWNNFIVTAPQTNNLSSGLVVTNRPYFPAVREIGSNGRYLLGISINSFYTNNQWVSESKALLMDRSTNILGEMSLKTGEIVALGSNGDNFLLVWQDRTNQSARLVSAIISTEPLRMTEPFAFSADRLPGFTDWYGQPNLKVASDGKDYLVTWMRDQTIYATPVSSNGVVSNPEGIAVQRNSVPEGGVFGGVGKYALELACNGENYLVVWRDTIAGVHGAYAARLSLEGVPLEASFQVTGVNESWFGRTLVAAVGSDYWLAWNEMNSDPAGIAFSISVTRVSGPSAVAGSFRKVQSQGEGSSYYLLGIMELEGRPVLFYTEQVGSFPKTWVRTTDLSGEFAAAPELLPTTSGAGAYFVRHGSEILMFPQTFGNPFAYPAFVVRRSGTEGQGTPLIRLSNPEVLPYIEGSGSILLDPGVQLLNADEHSLDGAFFLVGVAGASENADALNITTNPAYPGLQFTGTNIFYEGIPVASFSFASGESKFLSVRFAKDATLPIVEAVLRSVRLTPASTESGVLLSVQMQFRDAAGRESPFSLLRVQSPPRILRFPSQFLLRLGETVPSLGTEIGFLNAGFWQWDKNGSTFTAISNSLPISVGYVPFIHGAFRLEDGGSYTMKLSSEAGAVESNPLLLVPDVPVIQGADAFTNRISIVGTNGLLRGTNSLMALDLGEPKHAGKTGGKSVWFSWQSPASGLATFKTVGSTFDTLLAVYQGTDLAALQPIAADDNAPRSFRTSQVQFEARVGESYQIAIDGFAGAEGHYVLSWNLEVTDHTLPKILTHPQSIAVPVGSSADFAVLASGTGLRYQWYYNDRPISGATSASFRVASVLFADVGKYTVEVINNQNRSVTSLPAFLETGRDRNAISQDRLADLRERLSLGRQSAGLRPLAVSGAFVSVAAGRTDSKLLSNRDSTVDPGDPAPCGALGGASQWIPFVPEADGTLEVDTLGSLKDGSNSPLDTLLGVYVDEGAAFPQVACDDNSATNGVSSVVRFPVRAGKTYFLVADGVNAERGVIQLNWRLFSVSLNKAPEITSVPHQAIKPDGSIRSLTFSVTDLDHPVTALAVWAESSNPQVLPSRSLLVEGLGRERTLRFAATAGHLGNAVVRLNVTDGLATNYSAFQVVVREAFSGALAASLNRDGDEAVVVLSAVPETRTVLYSSSNLVHWTPILTNNPGVPLIYQRSVRESSLLFFSIWPAP